MSKERLSQNVRMHGELDQPLKSVLHKFRLSMLWIFGEVTLLTFLVLEYMEQGVMEGILEGNMRGLQLGPGTLLFYAVSLLIPLVMSILSLTMKDSMNRWVNLIVGVLYAALYLCDLVAHLAVPYAYAVLMGGASVVGQVLIVWYAWNWPKERITVESRTLLA